MLDINGVKATALVVAPRSWVPWKKQLAGLYLSFFPARVGAIGLGMSEDGEDTNFTDWGFVLKIVNPIDESAVLERIDMWWYGEKRLRAHNPRGSVRVSVGEDVDPGDEIENYPPVLIPPHSENLLTVRATLWLGRARPLGLGVARKSYSNEEIAQDHYGKGVVKATVHVTTNRGKVKLKLGGRARIWKEI